jgi:hypothetical protein
MIKNFINVFTKKGLFKFTFLENLGRIILGKNIINKLIEVVL